MGARTEDTLTNPLKRLFQEVGLSSATHRIIIKTNIGLFSYRTVGLSWIITPRYNIPNKTQSFFLVICHKINKIPIVLSSVKALKKFSEQQQ